MLLGTRQSSIACGIGPPIGADQSSTPSNFPYSGCLSRYVSIQRANLNNGCSMQSMESRRRITSLPGRLPSHARRRRRTPPETRTPGNFSPRCMPCAICCMPDRSFESSRRKSRHHELLAQRSARRLRQLSRESDAVSSTVPSRVARRNPACRKASSSGESAPNSRDR